MQTCVPLSQNTLFSAFAQKLSQLETSRVWFVYDPQTKERKVFTSEESLNNWLHKNAASVSTADS